MQCFWNSDYYICPPSQHPFAFYNLHVAGVRNTLCGVLRPNALDWFHEATDIEVVAAAFKSLKALYGHPARIEVSHVTRWSLDPYSLGTGTCVLDGKVGWLRSFARFKQLQRSLSKVSAL